MKNTIKQTLVEFEQIISDKNNSTETTKKNMLEKIQFFQQERMIHLIVTLSFALFSLLSFFFFYLTEEALILVLGILFVMLLIPYIAHYYTLENGVQKMYQQYDQLKK